MARAGVTGIAADGRGSAWVADVRAPVVYRITDGSWTEQELPSIPVASGATVAGIDAATPADVWAVGSFTVPHAFGGGGLAFSAHFDGQSWTVEPTVTVAPRGTQLEAVSTNGASSTAVGFEGWRRPSATALRWDGSRWHPSAVHRIVARRSELSDLSIDDDQAWAVGFEGAGSYPERGRDRTLVLRQDAHRWSRVASPNRASRNNYLTSVVTVGPEDAWAVGRSASFWDADHDVVRPLVEHWDGTKWRAARPSFASVPRGDLVDVVELMNGDIVAVGNDYGPPERALVERWDGSSWRRVDVPALDGFDVVAADAAGGELWIAANPQSSSGARPIVVRTCESR